MPNTQNRKFGAEPLDIRHIQRSKIIISSEHANNGKRFVKAASGEVLTDQQIDTATIIEASLTPPSYFNPIPPIDNQLGKGSCVAWAVVYYGYSLELYKKLGATSFNRASNVFSPEYLFDNVTTNHTGCDGSSIITSAQFLQNNGCVLWNTMPYDQTQCTISPTLSQINEAALYKAQPYSLVTPSDTAAIKSLLLKGYNLAFQFGADDYYLNPTGDMTWRAFGPTIYGYHANCVYGYDDARQAFKVANQWGTSWGDAGSIWIDYAFFGKMSQLALIPMATAGALPVSNAGFDSTVTAGGTATLDGSASYDTGGTIKAWSWTQASGPNTATILSPINAVTQVTNLIEGTYVFKLGVTDLDNNVAYDTVSVVVIAAPTPAPPPTPVPADNIVLSGTTRRAKNVAYDTLTWNIATAQTPLQASIETASGSGFATIYNILPYVSSGNFTTGAVNWKATRKYRLKLTKYDGTIVYSTLISVK